MRTKYLIVGNSAGGIGAVEAIRQVDKEGLLTIVSDEPYPAYSRPLISKYLTGERSLEGILFRPTDFYGQNDIVFVPNRKVTLIELGHQIVQLEGGDRITWERLLLAVGGKPIVPRMRGDGRRGIFTFTTLDDAKATDVFLDNAKKAVVIGGGLIGISVTEALVKRGVDVTVVEMKETILNTIMDQQASLMAEEVLRQEGVEIITGHTVAEISGGDRVEGVILDNGDAIACDLVLVAIGVSPRSELAVDAGIEVNRGIVVDRHMATNRPNVYACGDVAEAYDFVYEQNRLTPIWPIAYIGGRIAGYNMAGVETEYPGGTAMNSLNYFGTNITSAGMATPPDDESYEVISKQKDSMYQKVILKDDFIVGMVFVGNIEKSGIFFGLMRDRVNVGSFKQMLLMEDFGLAFLPRAIWQEGLVPSPELILERVIPIEAEEETFAGE
ncbi:MAG: NAD(P)/FAD-dependent oxidoreductase [Chloroflexi bacterium]|nr:NAD(P)/FAD-dependent oxidoreductase [Chloroflexota bacterium]